LRFVLQKKTSPAPSFRVHAHGVKHFDSGGYHGTMGISPDLMEGSRIAVRNMVSWIREEHELSAEDAYLLCSFAGDLRIIEIVDGGVWTVAMTMPLRVFGS
jgi:acetamidase/formamidase